MGAVSAGPIDSAFAYARRGWHVLPCRPRGKEPSTRNGLKNATLDLAMIRAWQKYVPDANVAIRTGVESGFVVLDVDSYDGGDESLLELEQRYSPLPETVEALTGRGGRHLLFAHPGGTVRIHNTTRLAGMVGLDVRGDGGYIVAPPSIHPNGRAYVWEITHGPDDVPLAPLPDWLLALMVKPEVTAAGNNGHLQAEFGIPLDPEDVEKAARALETLAATRCDDYDGWLRVGMALTELGDTGLELWERWSQKSDRYESGVCAAKWQSFNRLDGTINLGSLIRWAREDAATAAPKEEAPETAEAKSLTANTYPYTEAGNAELFARLYGNRVRHDHKRQRDLLWRDHWWQEDADGALVRMALKTARLRKKLAGEMADPEKSKTAFNWAVNSESRSRLMNTIEIARHLRPIADEGRDWDSDPFLLGVSNGVVDLRTGQLRPGQQVDRITMHTDVLFNAEAECPVWIKTLERILPDIEVRAFFKRLAGYGITGSVRDQVLPFLHGGGCNGKSTVLRAILDTVGDYGRQAAPDLLTYSKESRHPTEIADLYGARFVASVEVEEGKRLAEVLVKQMTGGDRLKGRKMQQDFFEFTPTHKVFLAANHKPVIKGTDTAIWRRMLLIPFTVTIPQNEVDADLPDKLHEEREGILRWLVEGALEWRREGLNAPLVVKSATSEYKKDMDIVAAFMEDCCVVSSGMRTGGSALYKAYREWCEANGERYERNNVFALRLAEKGYQTRRSSAKGTIEWHGLGLLTTSQQSLPTVVTVGTTPNWGIPLVRDFNSSTLPQNGIVPTVTTVAPDSIESHIPAPGASSAVAPEVRASLLLLGLTGSEIDRLTSEEAGNLLCAGEEVNE